MAAPRITAEERRARLARRHRLGVDGRTDDDVVGITRDLVVLHASDPSTVYLSAMARMAHPAPGPVEAALYDDRSLVRMLGMRRTLFTVPRDLVPVVHASSTLAVAANERRKIEVDLGAAGIADPPRWLRRLERDVVAALAELGSGPAAALTKAVPDLGRKVVVAPGTKHEVSVTLTSRLLVLLGADGLVVRARPTGDWTSSRHAWASLSDWLGAPIEAIDPTAAKADLARRWLARFGPGTAADLKWWTGWTMGAARQALRDLEAVEVDLDGEVGHVLPGDEAPGPAAGPWVALLPGLDPTSMGWTGRSWYLPDEHRGAVIDRTGNIGATVWVDGRIVGGWAQRADGHVATRLLEDVGTAATAAVDAEAARLEALLADVRVKPRFPAPLDRELSATA